MTFASLGLNEALVRALDAAGYATPTRVQATAIPPALAGADLMVSSSTGSGKTAAFMLPALTRVLAARATPYASRLAAAGALGAALSSAPQREARRERPRPSGPRVLVLAPTRELALQVAKAATVYGRNVPALRVATVVGGVPYPAQIRALKGPLDILIATPGRLLDHLAAGKAVLDHVELLVLDEADRMLDLGFVDDIRTIAAELPPGRQTLMTSATFGGHVGDLARGLMRAPQRIDVASHTEVHADIEQRLHWADDAAHKDALLDRLLVSADIDQALVFTSTQRDADILADRLAEAGHSVAALHGGMPQGRRNRVLRGLREKHLRVLVATDVAARGIDVPTISHVINYGLPMKPEDYVHRIGRTGRAGRSGLAVTLAERFDGGMIGRIQRFTTQAIPVATVPGLEPRRPAPQSQARRGFGEREGRGGKGGWKGQPKGGWSSGRPTAPAARGGRPNGRPSGRAARTR
jgi:superfamily II DNA/RNA helicase